MNTEPPTEKVKIAHDEELTDDEFELDIEGTIVVFYPNLAEINARQAAGICDYPPPHANPEGGIGVVRTWAQVDAEIQNNANGNVVGERIGNGIPGCYLYRFTDHMECENVMGRLRVSLPWTQHVPNRPSIAQWVKIAPCTKTKHVSKLETCIGLL